MNETTREANKSYQFVGLVPAAGIASRLSSLPCSKEIYPVGFSGGEESDGPHPKVVCHYLLRSMSQAGISNIYYILRPGKWDVPAYLGDGAYLNVNLAYLIINQSSGVPFTLDQAYPFINNNWVALGFPDIIFAPDDAYTKLIERQKNTGADIVLGLFPTSDPQTADMVELDDLGRMVRIVIKPQDSNLRFAWTIAIWSPNFTRFMHTYLTTIHQRKRNKAQRELFVGDILQAAIEHGLGHDVVIFPGGSFVDIGTPEGLSTAIHKFM